MSTSAVDRTALDRGIFLGIGALAGAAAYLLSEVLPDRVENDHLLLLLIAATGGFFSALLAALGPLRLPRAVLAAAASSLPAAGLFYWASFRFQDVGDYLDTVHPAAAFAVIVSISLPFLIAAQRAGEGWRHYPSLFNHAWNIVVRYAAAWVFTGVFWGVVALSDALFKLVGLDIIQKLLDIDFVPYVLTGATLGLAMAVVVELSDYVSPFLILRLLRLLMPVILLVTAVFLVALPVQGLSDLFGGLSAAATLLAMALGIATLITSALDRRDDDAVDSRFMRLSAQLLALALPVLAVLGGYAIWLRVAAYGWSPDRLAAAAVAAVVLGYGVFYALAVVLRGGWMARVRGVNTAMALVAVAISVLWLSPVIDPQRIAARDQVARFERGAVGVAALDLWFIGRELGVAGEAAITRLAALDNPEAVALATRLARLQEATSRYDFERAVVDEQAPVIAGDLARQIAVLPEGYALPNDILGNLDARRLLDISDGCQILTPAGNVGCVLVFADFLPHLDGDEGLLIYATAPGKASLRVIGADRTGVEAVFLSGSRFTDIKPETIDALLSGGYVLGPAQVPSLRIGGAEIIITP